MLLLKSYENFFQQREVLYASLFATAGSIQELLGGLGAYLSALANQLYGPYGITTTPEQVQGVLGLALQVLPDPTNELNATAEFVKNQLAAHHIAD